MTCQHCGAALPPIAMFCGECGRSVTAAVPPPVQRPVLPTAAPAEMPWSVDAPLSISPASPAAPPAFDWSSVPHDSVPQAESACEQCGTIPQPGDAFCAECGHALVAETRVIERLPEPESESEPEPVPEAAQEPEPEPEPELDPEPDPEPEPAPEPQRQTVAPSPQAAAVSHSPEAPAPEAPAPESPLAATATDLDIEQTRLVPRGTGGARFVLQFSTGESYTVLGSGLAGRNPRPEPSEVVDHLVTIVDPGRSVSKTHLEFGQEAGVFWVSDRHSGNGSVIREPGEPPRPCEPGRRYAVMRGTRIDMGEQFVIVS